MEAEDPEGSVEYKLKLIGKTSDRIENLATQMRYRCDEGGGECLYELGVADCGDMIGISIEEFEETMLALTKAAAMNNCSMTVVTVTPIDDKHVYEVLLREKNENSYIDLKVAMAGSVDTGKCEKRDTKILLYSGAVKNIQDITTDDVLMGDNSDPRRVLSTTSGIGQLYTITPYSGESLTVNKNHVLCFKSSYFNNLDSEKFMYVDDKPKIVSGDLIDSSRIIKYKDIVELSLEEYVTLGKTEQEVLNLYRVGVEYAPQDIAIDAYYLGCWLGNGNVGQCSYKSLDKYDLLHNKHIPKCYKYNTRKVRLSLLAGFIDVHCGWYKFTIARNAKRLCNDMLEVIQSLGFSSSRRDLLDCVVFKIEGVGVEDIPCLQNDKYQSRKEVLMTGIKSIEKYGKEEYYGFVLDGNQRYLHSDFTVTHNSSITGTMTTGMKDDGRGSARVSVFNFSHEVSSGRTSSVAHRILGFDHDGKVVNHRLGKKPSWHEIVKMSSKIINFTDLPGHERYLKTAITNLSVAQPDICFILVGANRGVLRNTREHIFLCATLNIPFALIISKVDIVKDNPEIMEETIQSIKKILKLPLICRLPVKIKSNDDVVLAAKNVKTESIAPIFYTSSVTGEGIDLLQNFLNILPKRTLPPETEDIEFHIDSTWSVPGIGTVVGGYLVSGYVRVGDKLLLGPNNGVYETVSIRSIHCKRVPKENIKHGAYTCFALKKIAREMIRKGNVLISLKSERVALQKFDARITVMRAHSTTIRVGYEPVVHASAIRQSARLTEIKEKTCSRNTGEHNDNILRTGDKALVSFEFQFQAEYLKTGTKILLCEGCTKVVGEIV